MITQTKIVQNKTGLHARPASVFAKEAAKFQAKITLTKGEKSIDPKSILKLLSLGISQGTEIVLTAEGADEEAAMAALTTLIDSKFGEE